MGRRRSVFVPNRSSRLIDVLEIGQLAPDLKLLATSGEEVQLSEAFARNRATILAFYVLDFTPG
jgi:peroxiredoxin